MIRFLGLGAVLFGALACVAWAANKPETVRLWEGDAPLAQGKTDADIPTLTLYRPAEDKANGAAIVVCPGGGYGSLAPHENKPIAEWLAANGITSVVLKYRLAPRYHHPSMLNDAQRAVRYVRAHAEKWKIDPKRIGILGFSAGGHLASTAATLFDEGNPNAADLIDRISSRPDLAILLYPVITMEEPFTHFGSRKNLLGDNPDPKLIERLSTDKQVTERTPPTFLIHTLEDAAVLPENSLRFVAACRKAKVPVEFHLYEYGAHGFGLGGDDPILSGWTAQCLKWMDKRGFLKPAPR